MIVSPNLFGLLYRVHSRLQFIHAAATTFTFIPTRQWNAHPKYRVFPMCACKIVNVDFPAIFGSNIEVEPNEQELYVDKLANL